jgi:hypothetical protein
MSDFDHDTNSELTADEIAARMAAHREAIRKAAAASTPPVVVPRSAEAPQSAPALDPTAQPAPTADAQAATAALARANAGPRLSKNGKRMGRPPKPKAFADLDAALVKPKRPGGIAERDPETGRILKRSANPNPAKGEAGPDAWPDVEAPPNLPVVLPPTAEVAAMHGRNESLPLGGNSRNIRTAAALFTPHLDMAMNNIVALAQSSNARVALAANQEIISRVLGKCLQQVSADTTSVNFDFKRVMLASVRAGTAHETPSDKKLLDDYAAAHVTIPMDDAPTVTIPRDQIGEALRQLEEREAETARIRATLLAAQAEGDGNN